MKNELKLWQKYNEWVEAENNQLVRARLETIKQDRDAIVKLRKRHELQNKRKYQRELRKWNKLSKYKKIIFSKPILQRTYIPSSLAFPYTPEISLNKATYEGFLDWCVEKNRKNTGF